MMPATRALWFIESHIAEQLSLARIAEAAGASRFYLSRAFGVATGYSVMGYVRARRLTEAARRLAAGAPDILDVALEAGYGSHEAFTRAFRDRFGLTPEAIRAQGRADNLQLLEAINMKETHVELESPRFVEAGPMLVAGMGERYSCENRAGIPAQWQRFLPHFGSVPGQIDGIAYGVCCNADEAGNFDYVCGVAVADFTRLPEQWARLRIPARRYAVFRHRGHVADIAGTWDAILNRWLPESGERMAEAPDFERYDETFDSRTGMGGLEVWIPLEN